MLREYDPGFARWLSRDPIGEAGGLNLYGYVEDNPLNRIDPLGLEDDGSRPDLLKVETGSTIVDRTISRAKKVWDKVSPWKKYTKPAENVYKTVEDGIEAVNDAQKIKNLAGSDCDIGKLNDPNQNTWDDLKNKGKEGQGIFDTVSKYFSKLTGKVPGLNGVTAPATELGSKAVDQGAQATEAHFNQINSVMEQSIYDANH